MKYEEMLRNYPQINTDEHRFINPVLSVSICVYLWTNFFVR